MHKEITTRHNEVNDEYRRIAVDLLNDTDPSFDADSIDWKRLARSIVESYQDIILSELSKKKM